MSPHFLSMFEEEKREKPLHVMLFGEVTTGYRVYLRHDALLAARFGKSPEEPFHHREPFRHKAWAVPLGTKAVPLGTKVNEHAVSTADEAAERFRVDLDGRVG